MYQRFAEGKWFMILFPSSSRFLAVALMLAAGCATASVARSQSNPAPGAATPPASTAEDCLKAAFDIAQLAEDKKLSAEALDQVEGQLIKLEGHCDNDQFAAAAAIASELKDYIAKQ
jgi:hypothetical protein